MATTYDLALVVCTVGGVDIGGYGSEGGITPEWDSDLVEVKTTADGDKIYSRTNDRGCTVTIALSQHSRAYALLMPLLSAQQIGPVTVPLPFFMLDPSNRESISGECVFMNRPAPAKAKTAGEVEFKIHIPKATHGPPIV